MSLSRTTNAEAGTLLVLRHPMQTSAEIQLRPPFSYCSSVVPSCAAETH